MRFSGTAALVPILVALLACKVGKKSGDDPAPDPAGSSKPPNVAPFDQPGSAAPAATTRPGRSTQGLRIVEGISREQNGFVVIVGEVVNETGHAIRAPRISVELFDASGKPIKVGSLLNAMNLREGVYAERRFVPAGEKSVFRYTRDTKKLSAHYASHRLTVSARNGDPDLSVRPTGVEHKNIGHAFRVTGSIQNAGKVSCRSPQAVIAAYRSDGKLWDVRSDSPGAWFQKMLPPGQSAAFEYRAFPDANGSVTKIEVFADCEN